MQEIEDKYINKIKELDNSPALIFKLRRRTPQNCGVETPLSIQGGSMTKMTLFGNHFHNIPEEEPDEWDNKSGD